MRYLAIAAAMLMLAGGAHAEVVDKGAYGFRLKTTQQIAAPPAKVYQAIGEIGRWWSDQHTYSGKASNMTMPLTANACFCEVLPDGGGVRHGVVELAIPGRMVRVATSLGPLQDEGVSGALFFEIRPRDGGSELVTTYNVGGARDFVVSAAPRIDTVVGEQLVRLKAYIETGKP